MRPDQPDMISADPRRLSGRSAWVAVVLLAASLAAAIIAAAYYHGRAVSLQHQLRAVRSSASAAAAHAPLSSGMTMSSDSAALLAPAPLAAKVTVVAANHPAGQAYVMIMALLTGGKPHTRYTLVGGSCSPPFRRYLWAAGVTDAHGDTELLGPVQRIPVADEYWLDLNPGVGSLHPSLVGAFAAATIGTAYRSGPPMCGE